MLKIELKKIKLLNIILPLLIIPAIANGFGIINYLGNKEVLTNGWKSLWTQVSLFYFYFFLIPIIAIIVASLWYNEHKANLKNIRISPINNINFIIAKSIISLGLVALTQVYFFLLFYLVGKYICGLGIIDFHGYLYYIILSIILSLPLIFIFTSLSIKIKSLSVVVLVSAIGSLLGFLMSAQNIIPLVDKSIGLSYLALQTNNLRIISANDLSILFLFALGEIIISLILSKKFLQYES